MLLIVTPAWRSSRAIAAAFAAAPSPAGRPAPSVGVEEEESPEPASLPRPDVEIGRAADRRDDRVAAAGVLLRHRAEHDAAVAARRWSRYRASPRGPPHRLLN